MRAPYRERRLGVARWRGNGRFGHDGWPETSDEGPLDYGRLRRHRPPLRLELDSGKAGNDNPGDYYPRCKCDSDPPHLLPTRLPAPRDGRVLEHPLAHSVFIPAKNYDSQRDLACSQLNGFRLLQMAGCASGKLRKTTVIQRESTIYFRNDHDG